jgi:hypothetical protein
MLPVVAPPVPPAPEDAVEVNAELPELSPEPQPVPARTSVPASKKKEEEQNSRDMESSEV